MMAVDSRGGTEVYLPKKYQDKENSTESTKTLIEPESERQQKVPVVYYLSRNGQLEHPHFTEVPLSSPQGLYLRDVLNKLNILRGQGLANMYSWSSKRSYKNRFVWQDLSEDDLIYPCHGNEYILKGSQLLETSLSFRAYETSTSSLSTSKNSSDTNISSEDSNVPIITRRKNHSWDTFNDLDEHKVYKAKTCGEFNKSLSTQTDDYGRQRKVDGEEGHGGNGIVELSNDEKPPPPSNCSLATLPSYNVVDGSADIRDQTAGNYRSSGRMKASMVLMQLIACGSRRVEDIELKESKIDGV